MKNIEKVKYELQGYKFETEQIEISNQTNLYYVENQKYGHKFYFTIEKNEIITQYRNLKITNIYYNTKADQPKKEQKKEITQKKTEIKKNTKLGKFEFLPKNTQLSLF